MGVTVFGAAAPVPLFGGALPVAAGAASVAGRRCGRRRRWLGRSRVGVRLRCGRTGRRVGGVGGAIAWASSRCGHEGRGRVSSVQIKGAGRGGDAPGRTVAGGVACGPADGEVVLGAGVSSLL